MVNFKRKISRRLAFLLGAILCLNLLGTHVYAEDIMENATKITLSEKEILFDHIGATSQLKAEIHSADELTGNTIWESRAPEIAEVSEDGLVTAVSNGTTEVIAYSSDRASSDTCTVTVLSKKNTNGLEQPSADQNDKPVIVDEIKVTGITLNQSNIELIDSNKTYQLVADIVPQDATNKNVIWESSDSGIAKVDENGLVEGISNGYATISASTEDGTYVSQCGVSVNVTTKIESIVLSKTEVSLTTKGEFTQIKASVYPETASSKEIEWISSNPQVVEVDTGGNLKAVGIGSSKITVRALDGSEVEAVCNVTVSGAAVSGFEVNTEPFTLSSKGSTKLISTKFVPEDSFNKNVIWVSSNPEVATVDKKGKVTAIQDGVFQITGTTEDGNFVDSVWGSVDIKGYNEDNDHYDNTAPVVRSVRATTPKVAAPDNAIFEFDIAESGTGLKYLSVTLCAKDYSDQSKHYIAFGFQNFAAGSFSGKYSIDIPIDKYAPAGTWEIAYIGVSDMRGNISYASEVNLPSIEVISSERTDIVSPQINSVKVLTESTKAPGEVILEVDVTEEGSGIQQMDLDVRLMDDSIFAYDNASIKLDAENNKTGVHQIKYSIEDQYTYPGMWNISYITVTDKQGNYSVCSLGDTAKFKILSNRTDTKAPVLKSVHITPGELIAPGVINIELEIEENESGLSSIKFDLYNETHNTLGLSFQRIDVNQNNGTSGVYKATIPINAFTRDGEYYIHTLVLKDNQGNESGYNWNKDKGEEGVAGDGKVAIKNELAISLQTSLSNPNLVELIRNVPENGVILLNPDTPIITSEIFLSIAGTNKTLVINGDGVQWVFNGGDIDKNKIKDINTNTYFNIISGREHGFDENVMEVVFPSNGQLPGRVKIRLKSDYLFQLYNVTNSLKLSWLNEDRAILEDDDVICSSDSYTEFYLTHNSTFILSSQEAFSNLQEIKITPPQKTLYELGSKEMDLEGLVVNAVYSSGTQQAVNEYQISGFDGNKLGRQTITVNYENVSATFDVTVVEKIQGNTDKSVDANSVKKSSTFLSPKTWDSADISTGILSLLSSLIVIISLKRSRRC